jgi:hypothetical protein
LELGAGEKEKGESGQDGETEGKVAVQEVENPNVRLEVR